MLDRIESPRQFSALTGFHPAVAGWFARAFPAGPTPTQEQAWTVTRSGGHALVCAPTGSGKTLAAFLAAIDDLVVRGQRGPLPDSVQVLYVSPLKALSNDIEVNLQMPLNGIRDRLFELGHADVGIRSAVRTGDTTAAERALMRRQPPHILVTTPESLFILLGSDSGRTMLAGVRSVIVDELHALAGSKRGAHLMLSLERLVALCPQPPSRVGLSATVKPIERVAGYLVGGPEGAGVAVAVGTRDPGPGTREEHKLAADVFGNGDRCDAAADFNVPDVSVVAVAVAVGTRDPGPGTREKHKLAADVFGNGDKCDAAANFNRNCTSSPPPRSRSGPVIAEPSVIESHSASPEDSASSCSGSRVPGPGSRHQDHIAIIDTGHVRARDLALELPSSPLDSVMSNEVWVEVYDRLAVLASEHRTTLVFVNQRRIAERVARHLAERIGAEHVTAHHGSLAKEHRFDAEQRLKAGRLKALVATSSLELGIDIGDVDLVCQLGSPRWISALLQRVGRAGHAVDAISKGRLFPLTLDDLIECTALLDAVRRGELDCIRDIGAPLDVLAQQVIAEVGSREWAEDELYALVRRAAPYRSLPRARFDAVVRMLAEGYATRRGRRGAWLHHDTVQGRLRARRGARLVAATNAGVIPDQFDCDVVLQPQGLRIGSLNEDFAFESVPGDIFQLGNAAYRIIKVETGRVLVEDAKGQPPSLPFWFGEALGRSDELSFAVSRLVGGFEAALKQSQPAEDELDGDDASNHSNTCHSGRRAAAIRNPHSGDDDAIGQESGFRVEPAAAGSPGTTAMGEAPGPGFRSGTVIAEPSGAKSHWASPDDSASSCSGSRVPGPGSRRLLVPGPGSRGLPIPGSGSRSILPSIPGIPASAIVQIHAYLGTALATLGTLPTLDTIVIERFFDEVGDSHLVIHSPYGSRINKAWGLALRKRFCRQFNFELQASALEDSIVLSLGPTHSFPLADVMKFLHSASARDVLIQALLDVPMFPTRFRWTASIALAIRRMNGGRRVPPQFQRSDAEDLLTVVFPDQVACAENLSGPREIPDHPLVVQTLHDCLHETMDVDGFLSLLQRLEAGTVRVHCRDLTAPSVLANAILNARPYAFLDDGEAEERRTRAVSTQRLHEIDAAAHPGRIDPQAVAAVCAEAWPLVRDADELHDALVVHGFLTGAEVDRLGRPWLLSLQAAGRAWSFSQAQTGECVVATERLPMWCAATGDAAPVTPHARAAQPPIDPDPALRELLRGRLELLGPVREDELAASLPVEPARIAQAMLQLEGEGSAMRVPDATGELWCDRRLLARIHRLSREQRRAAVQAVPPAQFLRFLCLWHALAWVPRASGAAAVAAGRGETTVESPSAALPTSDDPRRAGDSALLAVLQQLEGWVAPAVSWERDLLPQRLRDYAPAMLDRLCASGRLVWWRPVAATSEASRRRAGPVAGTPILFAERSNLPHWQALAGAIEHGAAAAVDPLLSGKARRVRDCLQHAGALFLADLEHECGLIRTELEPALAELVAQGLVGCDSFAGLRALIAPARQQARQRRRVLPADVDHAGRWSLLRPRRSAPTRDDGASGLAEPAVEHAARVLLRRYGVVFRAVLARETHLPSWRALHYVYRRMEARGEILGGRFVDGFAGEQFALPEAAVALRGSAAESGRLVAVAAADPLNLVGIIAPGDRLPAIAGNRLLLRDGVPAATRSGRAIQILACPDPVQAHAARMALLTARGSSRGVGLT